MMRSAGVLVVVVAFVVGCSDGPAADGPIDCAWLAGDNCWKTTAASAVACLPPAGEVGVLSADNSSCTYASGARVAFAKPIVFPITSQTQWSFTITNGGTECLRYENRVTSGITLSVNGSVVSDGPLGTLGLRLTCPDGDVYETSNVVGVTSCGGATFGGLPGHLWQTSGTHVKFSLLGASSTSSGELPLFDCSH